MKILILGSGSDRIGKTGELDRFAIQALRFLKMEGNEIIWVDNNPITLTSASKQASRVYLEPMTLKLLEKIIAREKPDAIMHNFGGCLAMHLVIFLDREGILDRYNVRVLGTTIPSLRRFMDSEIFKKTLRNLGIPIMDASVTHNVDECYSVSHALGFPIILRPAFALEGIGGYLAYNIEEVKQLAYIAFNLSPVQEVIIERAPADWIQFAIEGIHDLSSPGKVHLVGTFEALDGGVGVHPGNSVVIAPSPTLKNDLLKKALHFAGLIAKNMEICGSYQVRFALSPSKGEIVVLRVVYGLNRFSSLLSILHSIPLAEINAALSLGFQFEELNQRLDLSGFSLQKDINLTMARVPVLPDEFQEAEVIESTMRSTGAAVFFGRTLSMVLTKALDFMSLSRFIKPAEAEGLSANKLLYLIRGLEHYKKGVKVSSYAGINPAFLPSLKDVVSIFRQLKSVPSDSIPDTLLREAKATGLSDEGIAQLTGLDTKIVRKVRNQKGIPTNFTFIPADNQPEGKDPSIISYSEATIKGEDKRNRRMKQKNLHNLLILGPGPYKIGWGSEVDQALVQIALTFKEQGKQIILINNNPEAVSQDLGAMDYICHEMPTLEVIESIIDNWSIEGVIHQFCLSIPDGLENLLEERNVKTLGTPLHSLAEIRNIPYLWKKLKGIGIPLLNFALASDFPLALSEATKLGYPILARLTDKDLNPEAEIIYNETMLRHFLDLYQDRISTKIPIFMETFREGMLGTEALAICDGKEAFIVTFIENIEEYGVHSGDCASAIPTLSMGALIRYPAEDAIKHIVSHFNIVGHLQIELAIKGRNVYVTGVWPYPGRNTPFAEKAVGQTFHANVAQLLLGNALQT